MSCVRETKGRWCTGELEQERTVEKGGQEVVTDTLLSV